MYIPCYTYHHVAIYYIAAPPNPVKLLPDNFGSMLSAVLRDVELIFECVCSNVLEVIVKWNVYHPTSTTCTVDMIDKAND